MKKKSTQQELEGKPKILKRKDDPQISLDSTGVIFIELCVNGNVTRVSNKTCEVLGYKEKDILGKNWVENFVPKYVQKELFSILKNTLSGKIKNVEYHENPILTKNGEERRINWLNTIIRDKKGTITGHLSYGEDLTEKHQIKQNLIRSKSKLLKAQSVARIGFLEWELKTNKIELSESLVDLYGLKIGTKYIEVDALVKMVYAEDIERVQKRFKLAIKNKKKFNIDHRIIRPDGKIIWVQSKADLIYDDQGNKVGLLGTSIDITERKSAEELLEQQNIILLKAKEKAEKSEAKFEELSNLTFEGVIIHNNGVTIDVNQSFAEMFGYNRSDLIGKNIIKFLFSRKHQQIITKSISKNSSSPYEVEGIRKDGTIFPVEIEARNFISKNNTTLRVAAVRDITERNRTIIENKKLSKVIDQSGSTILITDIEGNIEYVNKKFTADTGFAAKEVLGKNPRFLNSGKYPKEIFTEMWETILAGETWKGEFLNKDKNKNYYWEYQINTPIKDDSGQIVNYLSTRENITDLKESELRLKTLFEFSPNPIIFKDGEGKWTEANKAGLEMFNLQGVDYYGKTTKELAPQATNFKEALFENENTFISS